MKNKECRKYARARARGQRRLDLGTGNVDGERADTAFEGRATVSGGGRIVIVLI